MLSLLLVFVGLLSNARGITVDDFYPFNPQKDQKVPNGDSESSHRIALSVPAKFYNNEYDHLWINTDGYITFNSANSLASEADFPYREALLAPYMSNLDTTNRGDIFYRESHDTGVLRRATSDVRQAYPRAAAGFSAESAYIVTWYEVEGQSMEGDRAVFTFQCILISNGRDSFAIFLYPERKMGVFSAGIRGRSVSFQAKAGFNEGGNQFMEMYPVESLVDHRNTRHEGEWIFQIGGDQVRRQHDIIAPERLRHRKRQAVLINVQEVNLEGEEDSEDEIEVEVENAAPDYCSRDSGACLADNSRCVNFARGYCCRCRDEFFGNGKVCLADGSPVRVNGNVSGVVDIYSPDGSIDRINLRNGPIHSYVITSEGRAFSAVSNVVPALGLALQPISTIGEVIGWLFARASGAAVNGFHYTGGSFQRRVTIRFNGDNKDYRFDMRQRFFGVREENNVSVVIVDTQFVGKLPAISPDASVNMRNYEEKYKKDGQGRISSNAVRHYTVNDVEYSYNVQQTIIFNECRESMSGVPNELKLHVTGNYLSYDNETQVVRYAMNDRISAPGGVSPSHPCQTGTHRCHSHAECEATEGQGYSCQCDRGFVGDGYLCEDVDECIQNVCPVNSMCFNSIGSFDCECLEGYAKNAYEQCEEVRTRCECGEGICIPTGNSYVCGCSDGFYYENGRCYDINECADSSANCDDNATCANTEGSFQCLCRPGYTGDGQTCDEIECPGNQFFSTCAGCRTTCEERGIPKICTLQCRMECTCPPNTFLNGDMCVSEEQCPELTLCQRQVAEVEAILSGPDPPQDGPQSPDCDDDGNFERRQCNAWTQVCWCVEPESGIVVAGSMSEPGAGNRVDCSRQAPQQTRCQRERQQAQSLQTNRKAPVYLPLCTAAGAYEPIQYHPNGYFLCVDENGNTVSRHRTQPTCLTPCQLRKYYAETTNRYTGTSIFVPQCTESGEYSRVQCNFVTRRCFCATRNGEEVPGTERVLRADEPEATEELLECDLFDPPIRDGGVDPQVIFAQSTGLNTADLPISSNSMASRLYARAGQTVVGVAYDCSNQKVYWTDVGGRSIRFASMRNFTSTPLIINGLKSPEGIAVDFLSGNIYWTDSRTRTIEVADNDGSNRAVLIDSGLVNPRGIAVDPFGGKMYWTDWNRNNPRIMTANMDGSEVSVFTSEGLKLPNDITIDQHNRRLCFIDAGTRKIECMNLDGSDRSVEYDIASNSPRAQRVFGLAVNAGRFYFTDRQFNRLHVYAKETRETFSIEGPVGSHGRMYGVALVNRNCKYGYNRCSINNGGCSHLCLPVPGGNTCKCPDGSEESCSEE